jgi:hypothetical protein
MKNEMTLIKIDVDMNSYTIFYMNFLIAGMRRLPDHISRVKTACMSTADLNLND